MSEYAGERLSTGPLAIYNYYRLAIGVLLALVFVTDHSRSWLGAFNPDLFRAAIAVYVAANLFAAVIAL